jgi:hypothetical protein
MIGKITRRAHMGFAHVPDWLFEAAQGDIIESKVGTFFQLAPVSAEAVQEEIARRHREANAVGDVALPAHASGDEAPEVQVVDEDWSGTAVPLVEDT